MKLPKFTGRSPVDVASTELASKQYELDERQYADGEEFSGTVVDDPTPVVLQSYQAVDLAQAPGATLAPHTELERMEESFGGGSEEDFVTPVVPLWRQMLRVFVQNRLAVLSLFVLVGIIVWCFLGKYLYATNQTNSAATIGTLVSTPPSWAHPLGVDYQGWDVLGRIMYGGEYSLTVGALGGVITIVVGTFIGMLSGYVGGIVDAVIMRFIDALLSIPLLFLLLTLVTIFHPSTAYIIGIIGFTGWFGNARIIRGDALVIRELEYSQAARSMGARSWHIIRRHVYPNSISNIVTVGTFSVADAILFLSFLGFLNLGVPPPGTDWGTLMANGADFLINNWWWELWPVAATFVTTIVCINYIGDALRDVFEVRLRER